MVQGYLTAVRYHAVYELQFLGMQGQRGIAAVEGFALLFRQSGYLSVEYIVFVQRYDGIAPAGSAEILEKEYTQSVLYGISAMNERKCGLKVPYTSSVIIIRLGLSSFTMFTMRAIVSGLSV